MSLPEIWLLDEPWGLLDVEGGRQRIDSVLEASPETEFLTEGARSPCLALPASVESVWHGASRETLPSLSVPFPWGGDKLHLWALPSASKRAETDRIEELNLLGFRWKGREITFSVRQRDCVARPLDKSSEDDEPASSTPSRLQDFLDWQLGSFQELLDLGFPKARPSPWDSTTDAGVVRRGWSVARAAWLREDIEEDDPARMALIVRLARDKRLVQVLEDLCRSPHVILERYRGMERIQRIQELDANCLRWYARQPGRTPVEKAGPNQRLLAVMRRESVDTLENRVLAWTLDRCSLLAQRYLAQNAAHRSRSTRHRDVSRFGNWTRHARRLAPLSDLSIQLPRPVQPNYKLLHHSLYGQVWELYKQLIRNQRLEDDAWRWQRMLWKDSAHQLLCAYLTQPGRWAEGEAYESCTYVRQELSEGRWTVAPRSPGPFRSGAKTIQIIDPADGTVPPAWRPWFGGLGNDLLLLSQSEARGVERAAVTWFVQDWSTDSAPHELRNRCRRALESGLQRLRQERDVHVPMDGLLVFNSPDHTGKRLVDIDEADIDGGRSSLISLQLPPDVHEHVDDVNAGFDLMLDRLLSRRGAA